MEDLTTSMPEDSSAEEPLEAQSTDTLTSADSAKIEESAEVTPPATDYAALAREDLAQIKAAIPGLEALVSISELKDPLRYGALRDLGLSATEAFLATGGIKAAYDNRSHLTSSIPAGARGAAEDMPRQDYEMMRELFSDMSDAQLKKLYRKVTR